MQTIVDSVSTEIKIQRSRFLAFLYPADAPESVKTLLSTHQQRYADATHNCFAYVLGISGEIKYYSDAGEPSGTAGKPILNTLLRNDLTNVLAIVTRYYGGIKLGVKGLIDAYSDSVQLAIELSALRVYIATSSFEICCDYGSFDMLKHLLHCHATVIEDLEYGTKIKFTCHIPDAELLHTLPVLEKLSLLKRLKYRKL